LDPLGSGNQKWAGVSRSNGCPYKREPLGLKKCVLSEILYLHLRE
jgi:hypothetical protein